MEHFLAHLDFLSSEGALFMEWRNLAICRELCHRSRDLFLSRLLPIRALQCFVRNAGYELLRKKDMPAFSRSFLEAFELNMEYMKSLKEDYFDEGRHAYSSSESGYESEYVSEAILREVSIFLR